MLHVYNGPAFRRCFVKALIETAVAELAVVGPLSFYGRVCVRRLYWAGMVTKGSRSSPLPSIIVNKNMMAVSARFVRQSRSSTQNH